MRQLRPDLVHYWGYIVDGNICKCGGVQRLVVNLYNNINGASKHLESMYANIAGASKLIHSKGYLWYKYTYTKTSTTGMGISLGTTYTDYIYSDNDNGSVFFNSNYFSATIGSDISISGNKATLLNTKSLEIEEYGNYDQNIRITVGSTAYTYSKSAACNNALKNYYVLTNKRSSISFSGSQRIGYKITNVNLLEGETGGGFPIIYGRNDSTIKHNAVNTATTYLFVCETTIVSSTDPNAYISSSYDWLGSDRYNTGNYVYGNSNVYYKMIS